MPPKVDSPNKRSKDRNVSKSEVALSGLLSILFLIALFASADRPLKSVAIWLLYIVVAGGVISVGAEASMGRVFKYALIPAATLFVAASFITLFTVYAFGGGICASCEGSGSMDYAALGKILLVYAAIFPPTVIGLMLGSYARTSLFGAYTKFARVKAADLRALRTKINIIISILSLLGTWLLTAKAFK